MRFENEFEFLSNFSKSEIILDGIIYPTVEHFFQAMKTKDPIQRAEIAAAPTPGKAKRLGRHVQLRSDWEEVKDQCMLDALRLKFADEDLGYKLQETGDKWLEEGKEAMDLMPYLSQFMGHSNLSATCYYIHLLPNEIKMCSKIDWGELNRVYKGFGYEETV